MIPGTRAMQHVRHWFDLGVSIWIGLFAVYYVALMLVGLLTRTRPPAAAITSTKWVHPDEERFNGAAA
jgi:hypothetical protein